MQELPLPIKCDYCDDRQPLNEGWHEIVDPEGIEGVQRIPCPKYTTKVIKITDTTTGETREYIDRYWHTDRSDEDNLFIWIDGNYACDCNRALFFLRAGGIEPHKDENYIEHPCGIEKYTIEIEGIYSE